MKVFKTQGTLYTNQTDQFPKKYRGNKKYIMVTIKIESNAILVEAMTSQKVAKMQQAYLVLLNHLKRTWAVASNQARPR